MSDILSTLVVSLYVVLLAVYVVCLLAFVGCCITTTIVGIWHETLHPHHR